MPRELVVVGGGFAGLWSALGAARKLDELAVSPDDVRITLINADAYHSIRVRNYEADLTPIRIPLDDVLGPAGVDRVQGRVERIDPDARTATVRTDGGETILRYDRLVLASGSRLFRPPIPGLVEHSFSVDTYDEAARLDHHLRRLPDSPPSAGRFTALVVGAGLTGLEVACELPQRLRAIAGDAQAADVRVQLVDHSPHVGSDMGDSARPVIEDALRALGVRAVLGVRVAAVDAGGVVLDDGRRLPAATTIWTAGMRASRLTEQFPVQRDRLGRLPVDRYLAVEGVAGVFAAGDVACLQVDDGHASVMSCQHGRPMGRFAGHNAVCDLLGLDPLPLRIPWYVTVLDLGPWGAVYTAGWDRRVTARGRLAKATKKDINERRIYPPLDRNRQAILAAAAPVVQAPPPVFD